MRPLEVLLVDDDEDYWYLVQVISKQPALAGRVRFQRVGDGPEALAYLRREPPYGGSLPVPDFVLLDQRMPLMDGTQVLQELRSDPKLRSVQASLMSTSSDARLTKEALIEGARFVFEKPSDLQRLIDGFDRILGFYSSVALSPRQN